MCFFTCDNLSELNKRELTPSLVQRTECIVAWKVFKYNRGKLFPVYQTLYTPQPNKTITTYGYNLYKPNVDKTGMIPQMVLHTKTNLSRFRRIENGFYAFADKQDAIRYLGFPGMTSPRSQLLVLRRVLLLDVHGEFETTGGRVYLSRVLWIFPKKGGWQWAGMSY